MELDLCTYVGDSGQIAAMEWWRKFVAWIVVAGSIGLYVAHGLSKARDIYEAPSTAAKVWGFVRNMFDLAPGPALFLLVAVVALIVAIWQPAYTQFVRSLLPSNSAWQWAASKQGGQEVMPKNVFQQGDNSRASNVHVGDINRAPDPELRELKREDAALPDGTHETKIELLVLHAVPALTVQAQAEGLIRAHIIGTRFNVSQSANANAWTESWGPAHGRYDLHVITKERVQIGLVHVFKDVHRP